MTNKEAIEKLKEILFMTGYKETLELAIKALEERPQGEWVPVSERLPEYGEGVLTYNSDDEYTINHIMDEDNGEWFYEGVLAWMPLPKPYKAESEDKE